LLPAVQHDLGSEVTDVGPSLMSKLGTKQFCHPLGGEEIGKVCNLYPPSSALIDAGRAQYPMRGILHYLGTDQVSGKYVNAGDKVAVLIAIDGHIDTIKNRVKAREEENRELQHKVYMLIFENPSYDENILGRLSITRKALADISNMENFITCPLTVERPEIARIDHVRKSVYDESAKVARDMAEMRKLVEVHEEIVRLKGKISENDENNQQDRAKLLRLDAIRAFVSEHGYVNITSCGWQRGRQEDVLSLAATYSWSKYTWSPRSSDSHPLGLPAGAWFQVELPRGAEVCPSFYWLRHGDDGSLDAPGIRADSDCGRWEEDGRVPPSGGLPASSWGYTTCAKDKFRGSALTSWELWASLDGKKWKLLSEHADDKSLHGAWQHRLWKVENSGEEKFRFFRVIMTGPSNNGGYSLFCSGFEVFGRIGEEEEEKPPPCPPMNLSYMYPQEVHVVNGYPIVENPCSLVSGTNDSACPISFAIWPDLPQGLQLDEATGTISGTLRKEELDEDWLSIVLTAKPMSFRVTASNLVGRAETAIRMLFLLPPEQLQYHHTDVTYEVGQEHLAFSAELIAQHVARGWQAPEFGPVDLPRTVSSNSADFALGSSFVWTDSIAVFTRRGKPVSLTGSWPMFDVSPPLPPGLHIDPTNGSIVGVPQEERAGTWEVTAWNPVGYVKTSVRIRILLPPRDMSYDYEEAVLLHDTEIGTNNCRVKGSRPLQFKADSLPHGLKINGENGMITGSPKQLDTDFRKYAVRCANEVGEAFVILNLICSQPIDEQDDSERLVNKDVEARIGQKVRGTDTFIRKMRMKGLKDPSANPARNAHDKMRSNKLVQEGGELLGSRLPLTRDLRHEAAAGRGTITDIFLDGNVCQVRWDNTGLVSLYSTGRDGEYELALWGTAKQLQLHWSSLPPLTRRWLHDDLEVLVEEFLQEHNILAPLLRPRCEKEKLVGVGHVHVYPPIEHDQCPQGSGLLQRIVHELDLGWMQSRKSLEDASLWMALQIRDKVVGMSIDWDPFIAFMEFMHRRETFRGGEGGGRQRVEEGGGRQRGDSGREEGGRVRGDAGRAEEADKRTRRKMQFVEVWLFIDRELRYALQDNFSPSERVHAIFEHERRNVRRMNKQHFMKNAMLMRAGMNLTVSRRKFESLFERTDIDKDGYIRFSDAWHAFTAVEQPRRRTSQQGEDLTWEELVQQVQLRPAALLSGAGDVHEVVNHRVCAPFSQFEVKSKSRALQQSRSGP